MSDSEIEVARHAKDTFNQYAARVEDAPNPMALLQGRLAAWQSRNFGACDARDQTLGVCEEAGELAHAVLKAHQRIRGYEDQDKLLAAVSDALGDLMVFATQVATHFRLDLWTVYVLTAEHVMRRDWNQARLEAQDPARDAQAELKLGGP
jgi:NTP pyrophosphatase (non-canonical NTP hydrolase)